MHSNDAAVFVLRRKNLYGNKNAYRFFAEISAKLRCNKTFSAQSAGITRIIFGRKFLCVVRRVCGIVKSVKNAVVVDYPHLRRENLFCKKVVVRDTFQVVRRSACLVPCDKFGYIFRHRFQRIFFLFYRVIGEKKRENDTGD